MKYLCLAWEEERIFHEMDAADWQAIRQETLEYVEALRARGTLLDAQPLKGGGTGSTVRVRQGETFVTDGPYIESKEIIGGFFLIEARGIEEAVEVAAAWPSARLGAIEVRPLEEGLPTDARY
jgi:hypothetical protein